ncbi:MAG: DNA methyltransferase [Microthrixaceae bacterium]
MARLRTAGRLHKAANSLQYVRYEDDFPVVAVNNVWTDTGTGNFTDEKVYVVQTGTKMIQRCMLMTTDPGDLVVDPTCGAGTTAYVAEQWGRRWITIDTSRVALALARTRLMCARFPYYLLADSVDGAAKDADLTGQPPAASGHNGDIRKGFVYKRVPHITLKSIAQNPDIKEGMSRDEIGAVIARNADSEVLVDQPYEDRKKVRVTGRFTVESLSPHRVLDDDRPPRRGRGVNDRRCRYAGLRADHPRQLAQGGCAQHIPGRTSASTDWTPARAPGSRPRVSSPMPMTSHGVWLSPSGPSMGPSVPTRSGKLRRKRCEVLASICWCCLASHLTHMQGDCPRVRSVGRRVRRRRRRAPARQAPGTAGTNEPRPGDGWRPS